MRRLVFALLIAAGAAGCTAAGGSSTYPPPRPLPSGCGGPSVIITNVGHSPVAVRIDDAFVWAYVSGEPEQTIPAGATAQLDNWDGLPRPPWDLEVTRSPDGVVLLSVHVVDETSVSFDVGDAPDVSASPSFGVDRDPVAMASPVSTPSGCLGQRHQRHVLSDV